MSLRVWTVGSFGHDLGSVSGVLGGVREGRQSVVLGACRHHTSPSVIREVSSSSWTLPARTRSTMAAVSSHPASSSGGVHLLLLRMSNSITQVTRRLVAVRQRMVPDQPGREHSRTRLPVGEGWF